MTTMATDQYTRDELQAAYLERRREGWPAFDEAMNHEFYHHLVCIEAGRRARAAKQRQQPQAHHQPSRPRQTLAVPSTPPVFDHKRRAAGEREDD